MQPPRNKLACFLFGGVNTFACSYYGNYLFFLLRDKHGFGNLGNLAVSAFHGLIFLVAAWQGGKFAQRFGYLTSLQTGFVVMGLALLGGWLLPSLPAQMLVLAGWTIGMCLTWPALEAWASHGEDDHTLPRQVGLYNISWSAAAAGSLVLAHGQHLGLHRRHRLCEFTHRLFPFRPQPGTPLGTCKCSKEQQIQRSAAS